MAHPPLIGVTADHIELSPDTENEYRVRVNYITALRSCGAQAVILPCELTALPKYLEMCDGFLISGSTPGQVGTVTRQAFESALIGLALEKGVPTLGVCNGMQAIGIHLGAQLLDGDDAGGVDHMPLAFPTGFAHDLHLSSGEVLDQFAPDTTMKVNSYHKQNLSEDGEFRVIARSPDGVVEAISVPDHPFCIGVQWHPEYLLSELDHALIQRFVAAARNG